MPKKRATVSRLSDPQQPSISVDIRQKKVTPENRPAIIDEFGRLGVQMDALRALQGRYEMLRAKIAGWYDELDPAESCSAEGHKYSVQIGPRSARRSIVDVEALFERLGEKRFLPICSVSLEKLDTVMLPADQINFIRSDRSGPRVVKPVAKFMSAAS